MRNKKSLKARFSSDPFVNGFTKIENENSNIIIGTSEKPEDIFTDEYPTHIRLICSITSKAEFPNVDISARYKISDDGDMQTMSYRIYNGSVISMNGFVSELSVNFEEFVIDHENFHIKESWISHLKENKVLYSKEFPIQRISRNIENFVDNSIERSNIIHTKTRAHPFGGSYFTGIKFSDIQPYLFYMGTGIQAKEYLSLISAREALQTNKVKLSRDIAPATISTLEDDICSGRVNISLDGEINYRSISVEKTTLTSDLFQILFKKTGD